MIKSQLFDSTGNKKGLGITSEHAALVTNLPYPPLGSQKTKPFRQYLTVDGTASGSNDMGVNGSVTNVDFYVQADDENDRYISNLNIIVGYGASAQPFQWADGTALSNGTRLFYESRFGQQDLHDGIKSNQDMFRLSLELIPTAWEVRGVGATNDYGYFINFDLAKIIYPYGIKLDRGTNQKLIMTVRDNAGTAADTFNVIAYGFDRFE